MRNEMKYYLFGQDLVHEYHENGLDSAVNKLKKDSSSGTFYQFDGNVNDLLYNFSGWGSFEEITKLEYNKIKQCN